MPANYYFAYSENNKATGDVKRHSKTCCGSQVRGLYLVLVPDGGRRLVGYTADGNGFRAHVQPRFKRQVPVLMKNYSVNLKRFLPNERQGLHTNCLTMRFSTSQRRFEKFLQKSQYRINSAGNLNVNSNQDARGLGWTLNDRYRNAGVSSPKMSSTTTAKIAATKCIVYNVKRMDYPLAQYHQSFSQIPYAPKEAIHDIHIKRSPCSIRKCVLI